MGGGIRRAGRHGRQAGTSGAASTIARSFATARAFGHIDLPVWTARLLTADARTTAALAVVLHVTQDSDAPGRSLAGSLTEPAPGWFSMRLGPGAAAASLIAHLSYGGTLRSVHGCHFGASCRDPSTKN